MKRNALFIQLVNLQRRDPVIEHIKLFGKLSLGVKNIRKDNLLYHFMGT